MSDHRNEGLTKKFRVRRTDSKAQERHKDCFVFVLEPLHDPLARVALKAYESAAREAGYLALADDLRTEAYNQGWGKSSAACWPTMNAQLMPLGHRQDGFQIVDNGNGHEWAEVGK